MSTMIEVKDLATHWTAVLESVRSGDEVLIVDQTVPQARLLPITHRRAGMHPEAMQMMPDFDHPLPEAFWVGAK